MGLNPKFVRNMSFLAILVAAYLGYQYVLRPMIPGKNVVLPVVPSREGFDRVKQIPKALPEQEVASQVPVADSVPKAVPAKVAPVKVGGGAGKVRIANMAWNSQTGQNMANGGVFTKPGSIMAQHGINNLEIVLQNDTNAMMSGLVAFANELASGQPDPNTDSYVCVAVMGDGTAAYMAALDGQLSKLGPEYAAKIVFSTGKSLGEDGFWAPTEVLRDPQKARGLLISGFLKDGDWNIGLIFGATQNPPICNNPDPKTYDPNCLNWVGANDFIDAAQKYISGYCEPRDTIVNGVITERNVDRCVNATVTWTPGDVMVAKERGGLVRVLSTKENSWQMPQATICIDRWVNENQKWLEGYIEAVLEANNAIIANPDVALKEASRATWEVYNREESPEYWERYYRGVIEPDATGVRVPLGGSQVHNLRDNLYLFGIIPGRPGRVAEFPFKTTYEIFGNIVHEQYPQDVPSFPSIDKVLNTKALEAVAVRLAKTAAPVQVAEFKREEKIAVTLGVKTVHIKFATGKSEVTPEEEAKLLDVRRQLQLSAGTKVRVEGHTDDVGSDKTNLALSQQRAVAVRNWFMRTDPDAFPLQRFADGDVVGLGESRPVVGNTNEQGRAQNRRVEVIFGN